MSDPRWRPEWDEDTTVDERGGSRGPRRFRVLLHNDDYTTMDFVVHVLVEVFHKSRAAATQTMLEVHHKGVGVAGVYTFELAESKVYQVTTLARDNSMPLRCTMEPEEDA